MNTDLQLQVACLEDVILCLGENVKRQLLKGRGYELECFGICFLWRRLIMVNR